MAMSTDELIRLATLVNTVDAADHPDNAELEASLKRLEPDDAMPFMVLSKLLAGEPYRINTDNPETIRRSVALAESLGAEVTHEGYGDGWQVVLLAPRNNQTQ